MRAYRGEVRCRGGLRPVTRWYAGRESARRHLRAYCDKHNLWEPSQVIHARQRANETIKALNAEEAL